MFRSIIRVPKFQIKDLGRQTAAKIQIILVKCNENTSPQIIVEEAFIQSLKGKNRITTTQEKTF